MSITLIGSLQIPLVLALIVWFVVIEPVLSAFLGGCGSTLKRPAGRRHLLRALVLIMSLGSILIGMMVGRRCALYSALTIDTAMDVLRGWKLTAVVLAAGLGFAAFFNTLGCGLKGLLRLCRMRRPHTEHHDMEEPDNTFNEAFVKSYFTYNAQMRARIPLLLLLTAVLFILWGYLSSLA